MKGVRRDNMRLISNAKNLQTNMAEMAFLVLADENKYHRYCRERTLDRTLFLGSAAIPRAKTLASPHRAEHRSPNQQPR